jgi:hypothetical protein
MLIAAGPTSVLPARGRRSSKDPPIGPNIERAREFNAGVLAFLLEHRAAAACAGSNRTRRRLDVEGTAPIFRPTPDSPGAASRIPRKTGA